MDNMEKDTLSEVVRILRRAKPQFEKIFKEQDYYGDVDRINLSAGFEAAIRTVEKLEEAHD